MSELVENKAKKNFKLLWLKCDLYEENGLITKQKFSCDPQIIFIDHSSTNTDNHH